MPKYGPRKGKERYAREMMDEIANKQDLLAKALGVPVGSVPKLSDAQFAAIDRTRTVEADNVGCIEPGRLVRMPNHHAYIIHQDGTMLEVEVEKTINVGRSLLRRLT